MDLNKGERSARNIRFLPPSLSVPVGTVVGEQHSEEEARASPLGIASTRVMFD
jgi:hypothetical protein